MKKSTFTTETIITSSVYNNIVGKLHVGINNKTRTGRTMCANLLHDDLVLWIKKNTSTSALVEKYFHLEDGVIKYSNPTK